MTQMILNVDPREPNPLDIEKAVDYLKQGEVIV